MGMCCEKKIMIGWRNVWSMKWRVPGQEVDQRKLGERLWKKTVKYVDWIGRMPWIVVVGETDRDDLWPRWEWVGECFFWYWLTRVVPDKIQRAVKRLCLYIVRITSGSQYRINTVGHIVLVQLVQFLSSTMNDRMKSSIFSDFLNCAGDVEEWIAALSDITSSALQAMIYMACCYRYNLWCHCTACILALVERCRTTYTRTQPFYCSSEICPGPPGWAGTRKVKPGRLKPIWIYWSKR